MPMWHRDSLFGAGPRRPLTRDQLARFRFLVRDHARARRLPAKAVWVAEALAKHLGVDGRLDPSHATLARVAGVGLRTAQRALVLLRALGLVHWQRRLVRAGWRAEQTSSSYVLTPEAAIVPPACDRQSGRQTTKKAFCSVFAVGSDAWGRENAARQLAALGFEGGSGRAGSAGGR